MRPPTINDRKLVQLLDKDKKSQTEAAKILGVSRQAVNQRIKELRGKITKVVVAKKIEQLVDKKIDAMEQLSKINSNANEILDLLMRWNRGDETALQVLESQVSTKKVRVGDEEKFIEEIKIKDPRELALRAMQEIRGQLSLQLELFKTMWDMETVREFQTEVLTAIGEVSPEVRNRIVERIKKSRALRSSVSIT